MTDHIRRHFLQGIGAVAAIPIGSKLTSQASSLERTALGNTLHVPTRNAMKAIAPVKDATIVLTEPGREGIFKLRSGNYSSHIAADPLEGVFIKVDSAAASECALVRICDELDVSWFGAVGDGSDATPAFAAAISLSHFLGLNRIVCKDATRQFKIVGLNIATNIVIDLGGATVLGDFGPWGRHSSNGTPIYWTRNIFHSVAAEAPSVKLKNMTLNGQSDPGFQMIGGVPMIDFRGGASPGRCVIEIESVTVTRGSNRIYTAGSGTSYPRLLLDARNMEILVYNADELWINDVEIRSCPGEMIQVQSDDERTRVRIDKLFATKARDSNPSSRWSGSALNVLNCHPTSAIRNSRFYYLAKSALNWESAGGLIETCEFENVSDSNAIDFNEASSYRFNQVVVRNCSFQDISAVGIRASSSNALFESNTFEKVNICISFEGDVVGEATRGSWLKTNDITLANNFVRNCWIKSFDPSHPDRVGIRVLGKDSTNPISVAIEGAAIVDRQPTDGKARYGIYAKNARLRLSGYFGDGVAALIYLNGTVVVRGQDMIVAPEVGQTVHTFQLASVTLGRKALILDNIVRQTPLGAGNYDFCVGSSNVDVDAIHINSSPDFAGVSNYNAAISRDGKLAGTATCSSTRTEAGLSISTTVTVTGARLGDRAEAFVSSNQNGLVISAYVSSNNTVTVIYFNPTGRAIDLAAHKVTAWVWKPPT
ncbi:hypothetical protein KGO5_04737 [Sinorhizobium sp. KGO-5]|nr:hypothetical protein KGO5_04737 [Sinorhizobium sp. KGO-5]